MKKALDNLLLAGLLLFIFGPWLVMICDAASFIVMGYVLSSIPYHDMNSVRFVMAVTWPALWVFIVICIVGFLA